MTERPSPQFIKMSPLDQTALSGMASGDHTQYLRITKMALRQFLQEHLKIGGQFRELTDRLASYTIGYVVNQELSDNHNERHLQIAVYYSDMRERPPQIFIQDEGYEYKTDSLGSIAAGWNMRTRDGHQMVRLMDVVSIPISFHLTALAQQEVEDLISFMHVAFGTSSRFTTNYYIQPEVQQGGVYWQIRVPLSHSISPKTHSPVHDDPRIQIWQATCSMTVEFENSVFMQYRSQPRFSPRRGDLALTFPSVVPLGQERAVQLVNYPEPITVYSDDARIAVVQQRRREWIIVPRRVGTFNIIVKRASPHKSSESNILAQQAVEVRAR